MQNHITLLTHLSVQTDFYLILKAIDVAFCCMAETKQDIHADIVAAFSALQNQFKEKYHAIKKR